MAAVKATSEYQLAGLDCASCASMLERSVAQLDGVVEASINFNTSTLHISGSPNKHEVLERVEALGYKLIADSDKDVHQADVEHRASGMAGFLRYLLTSRESTFALAGSVLLVASAPLTLLSSSPAAIRFAWGLRVLVVALVGYSIAWRGIRSLAVGRQITINLLMSIAALGALLIGEVGEAATVIVLFAIGEALEGHTVERARDSLRSLLTLAPEKATVLRPCIGCEEHLGQDGYLGGSCPFCGPRETTIPVKEVQLGDLVCIRPGVRIPVDGRIVSGTSSIDQSPITGESVPVTKSIGDEVFAGTINGVGVLEVHVTHLAADSTINRIVRLVKQAQSQRAPIERVIDRFARWYTPAVVMAAVLVTAVPPLLFGAPFLDTPDGTRGWFYRGLALLIVACPCALVISTPVTVVSTLAGLARRSVLVKGGIFLDVLARIKTFVFDKTGTLTEGQPMVMQVHAAGCLPNQGRCESCDEMLALAAAVERRSEHLLAQAILAEARKRDLLHRYPSAESVQTLAGRGIQGTINGTKIMVGSHTLFHDQYLGCEMFHRQIVAAEAEGQTIMLVSKDGEALGFISVADTPRPSSRVALQDLKDIDPPTRIVMLTGDNPTVANAVAQRIGVIDEVQANLLPEDKVERIRNLETLYGPIAMVGDGINDAPALAAATVGVAMGGEGTDQAMETADVILMKDDLTCLSEAVKTSRRARGVIRQNIALSLVVKAVFLLLTLPGWTTLWLAVFADMGASLTVTLNGMRMLRPR